MTDRQGEALLVGSVPLATTRDVFETAGQELGDALASVPDGEVGERRMYVIFQAHRVFHEHPALETIQRPAPVDGEEQWIPKGLHDLWVFEVRAGHEDAVRFDDLLYADAAIESYRTFCDVRDAGGLPPGLRFQVCLPTPQSATLFFFRRPEDVARVQPAYEEALLREVDRILKAVPHEDLAIQWDFGWEVFDVRGKFEWSAPGNAFERYRDSVRRLLPAVPDGVAVGLHLCHADLAESRVEKPEDLGVFVEMANAAAREGGRRIDYVHLPVPISRDDSSYFAPLDGLEIGGGRVFLGLVHHADGVEGTRRRLGAARPHLPERVGIAAECGLGQFSADRIPEVLRLHRESVDLLRAALA